MYRVIFLFLLPFCYGGGVAGSFRSDYQFVAKANGWFKLHLIPANWHDARLRCQLEGAVLTSPLNELLHEHIVSMFNAQSAYTQSPIEQRVFTGIHATFSKGDFFSIEGLPLSKIPHSWAAMEPDNHEDNESCIAMDQEGNLADVNCNEVMQYVCYRKHQEELVFNECGTIDNGYRLAQETGKCYKFHRNPFTWSRAFMTCAAEGGHLAIINSQNEADVIKNIYSKNPERELNLISLNNKPNSLKSFAFIGYHDWGEHGNWRTIHGQTLEEAGYSKWFAWMDGSYSEPNNVTSAGTNWVGEYCGAINRDVRLNDIWCDYVLAFICEKDPKDFN